MDRRNLLKSCFAGLSGVFGLFCLPTITKIGFGQQVSELPKLVGKSTNSVKSVHITDIGIKVNFYNMNNCFYGSNGEQRYLDLSHYNQLRIIIEGDKEFFTISFSDNKNNREFVEVPFFSKRFPTEEQIIENISASKSFNTNIVQYKDRFALFTFPQEHKLTKIEDGGKSFKRLLAELDKKRPFRDYRAAKEGQL